MDYQDFSHVLMYFSFNDNLVNGNEYKLLLPSGNPSDKRTKYWYDHQDIKLSYYVCAPPPLIS